MSRTSKYNDRYRGDDAPKRSRARSRRLSAHAVRRGDPDLRRMGRALILFALAEAEAQAEDEAQQKARPTGKRPSGPEAKP